MWREKRKSVIPAAIERSNLHFIFHLREGHMNTKQATHDAPAQAALVRKWIATYGAATVVDAIQTCALEWSYSLKPQDDVTDDGRFWREIERRLAGKSRSVGAKASSPRVAPVAA